VHRSRFRALITLDSLCDNASRIQQQYPNHTRVLMVQAHCPGPPGSVRYFPAEICWDDKQPLRPGDHAVVTITMTDDDAGTFFSAGHQFRLWCGHVVGHGTISRKVYTDYSPSLHGHARQRLSPAVLPIHAPSTLISCPLDLRQPHSR
jgi:hypothetical protein